MAEHSRTMRKPYFSLLAIAQKLAPLNAIGRAPPQIPTHIEHRGAAISSIAA